MKQSAMKTNSMPSHLLIAVMLFLLNVSTAFTAEDFSQWKYSVKLTLNTKANGANISASQPSVNNFPVLIRLNSANFNFAQLADQSGGTDIRFSNSNNIPLAYQIERCDVVAKLAEIWVKVDQIQPDNNTQYITMYWGKDGASNNSAPATVFNESDGWNGVWHLNGSSELANNSTSLTNSSSRSFATTAYNVVSDEGVVNSGIKMGVGKWINVHPSALNNLNDAITVSFWNYGSTSGDLPKADDRVDIIKTAGIAWYNGFGWRFMPDKSINLYWGDANGAEYVNYSLADKPIELWQGKWNHWAFSRSSTSWNLYINGAIVANGTCSRSMSGSEVTLFQFGSEDCGGDYSYRGKLDEMRMSSVGRNETWIALEYANQNPAGQSLVEMGTPITAPILVDQYSEWQYNQRLILNTTATGANTAEDVADFPVLIRLDNSNFSFSQLADQTGKDFRFSKSDGTHLSYQIERCSNGKAEIWVNVDRVIANNNAQYIKMYWGNSSAGDSSNSQRVFNESKGWNGVWHLNGSSELVNNPAILTNSSSRSFATTAYNVVPDEGVVNSGIKMGVGKWINVHPSALDNLDKAITVSFWNYGSTSGDLPKADDRVDIIKTAGIAWYNGFGWRFMPDKSINLYWGDVNGAEYVNVPLANSTALWKGKWNHWAFSRSGTSWNLYINGVSVANGTCSRSMSGSAVTLFQFGSEDCGGDYSYRGKLDEMRMSSVGRSGDWVKLEYENQQTNQTLVEFSNTSVCFPVGLSSQDRILPSGFTGSLDAWKEDKKTLSTPIVINGITYLKSIVSYGPATESVRGLLFSVADEMQRLNIKGIPTRLSGIGCAGNLCIKTSTAAEHPDMQEFMSNWGSVKTRYQLSEAEGSKQFDIDLAGVKWIWLEVASEKSNIIVYSGAFANITMEFASRNEDYATWPTKTLFFNTILGPMGTDVKTDLENFPVLVRLQGTGDAAFDFSQLSSNGREIRFTDADGIRLWHAIDKWDAVAQKAEIWVLVPRIQGNSDLDFINMHWKNDPALKDVSDWSQVFSANNGANCKTLVKIDKMQRALFFFCHG